MGERRAGHWALCHRRRNPLPDCRSAQKVDRWGMGFGWKWDEVLVMPIDTLLDRIPKLGKEGRRMFLLTDSPTHNDIVKRIVNTVLLERHHGLDDFRLFDFETRLKGFSKSS